MDGKTVCIAGMGGGSIGGWWEARSATVGGPGLRDLALFRRPYFVSMSLCAAGMLSCEGGSLLRRGDKGVHSAGGAREFGYIFCMKDIMCRPARQGRCVAGMHAW
jgi:hypothetical protein